MGEGVLQNPRPRPKNRVGVNSRSTGVVVVVYITLFHIQGGSITPFYSHGARNSSKAANSRGSPRTH
jgi:hypothetical protein